MKLHRLENCLFRLHPAAKSSTYRAALDARSSRPLHQRGGNAINGQTNIVSLVVCLLQSVCPLAVFRAVVAISVFAFDAVCGRRLWSHVLNKCLKRINPAVAHLDASAAVVLPLDGRFVCASLLYCKPSLVLRGFRSAFCGAMSCEGFSRHLFHQAPTRASVFCPQIESIAHRLIAAIANAIPECLSFSVRRSVNSNQLAKALTSQIIKSTHKKFFQVRKAEEISESGYFKVVP